MSDATTTLTPPAREAGAPKLSVDHLTVERTRASGERIVAARDVSFDIAAGEFVCLLGPSGCGKTSILNVLAGLDRPSAGRALLDGSPIQGPGPDRAVLFQDPALFPWLSVRANVELALELIAVGGAERRQRADAALSSVGLEDLRDAQPHELSAGMRAFGRPRRRAVRRPRRTEPRAPSERSAARMDGLRRAHDVPVHHA
jgi:NitT/TauT family transport system ATP-binding protein